MCPQTKSVYNEQTVINQLIGSSELPQCPYQEYDHTQLLSLVRLLVSFIIIVLAKVGVKDPADLQEALDRWDFSAHKTSRTSSMRPSSDLPRNNKADVSEGDSPSEDSQAAECEPAANTDELPTGDGKTQEEKDYEAFEEKERKSEEARKQDHHRSRRTSSGKKRGKQPGSAGHGFKVPDRVDEQITVIVPPAECASCPHWETECRERARLGAGHSSYDLEFRIIQTTYRTATVECHLNDQPKAEVQAETNDASAKQENPVQVDEPCTPAGAVPQECTGTDASEGAGTDIAPREAGGTKKVFTSEYPEGAKGPNQYGKMVRVLVCLLYCVGMVSLNRIRSILAPAITMHLSDATMLGFIDQMARLVQPAVDAILEAERKGHFVHLDETGANVAGHLYWVHAIATPLYTFVSVQEKRGKEGMKNIGFLEEYVGTIIHDCWASYFYFDQCVHSICNAHIERELAGISKFFENASQWADDMIRLLQEMLQAKHEAQNQGLTSLPQNMLDAFTARFRALISRGKEIHPIPPQKPGKRGRVKKGRARALVDRMEEREAEIFRFLTDFSIPYTNNEAERAFRLLGVRRSVSFFQSLESARNFCAIWSYLATARKHNIPYFVAAREAFNGNAVRILFPDVEKEDKDAEAA